MSDATDEGDAAAAAHDDSQKRESDDVEYTVLKREPGEQGSSDSKTSETSDEAAGEAEDGIGELADKGVPPSDETIRDRLEKAGVSTTGNKSLAVSC